LSGSALDVVWAREPRNVRGKLRLGGSRGAEVHAASFIRERRVVLDEALRGDAVELRRILVHELFHFAWVRLPNAERDAWKRHLRHEVDARARGELGWSAESRKSALARGGSVTSPRAWSEYCCESFCDTAAWMYAAAGEHAEFTLAAGRRAARRAWFYALVRRQGGLIRI
jgi:hypothetical protein